jgi:hypothetical protein
LSADQAKPGEMVNLTVTSDSNSLVGLLGVDQSVLLLKSGNDLDKSWIIDESKKFNEKFVKRSNSIFDGIFGGTHSNSHLVTHKEFDRAGLVILTNVAPDFGTYTQKKTISCF